MRENATALLQGRGDDRDEIVQRRRAGRGGVREEGLSAVARDTKDGARFRF